MFPSFDIFQQVFSEVTEDYGCMVINNRVHGKNITEKVFGGVKLNQYQNFLSDVTDIINITIKITDNNWKEDFFLFLILELL